MSEKRLVLDMLAEGKISQEEAEQLLEAMGEIVDLEPKEKDGTLQNNKALDEFIKASDKLSSENRAETSDLTEFERLDSEGATDLDWLYVKAFAGNIKIIGDDSITAPKIIVGEKYSLSEIDNIFLVKPIKSNKEQRSGSFIDGIVNFVDNLSNNAGGDLELLVPNGFAVKLKVGAGDLKARNIEFLSAKQMAGNAKVKNVSGLVLNNAAGDIKVSMLAGKYDNKIKSAAGNIDLKLLAGSSTEIKAKLSVGELSHEGFDEVENFELQSSLIGSKLSAIVGDGSAKFDIKLSAGNLDLELEQ